MAVMVEEIMVMMVAMVELTVMAVADGGAGGGACSALAPCPEVRGSEALQSWVEAGWAPSVHHCLPLPQTHSHPCPLLSLLARSVMNWPGASEAGRHRSALRPPLSLPLSASTSPPRSGLSISGPGAHWPGPYRQGASLPLPSPHARRSGSWGGLALPGASGAGVQAAGPRGAKEQVKGGPQI